jgi:hypothetical protein
MGLLATAADHILAFAFAALRPQTLRCRISSLRFYSAIIDHDVQFELYSGMFRFHPVVADYGSLMYNILNSLKSSASYALSNMLLDLTFQMTIGEGTYATVYKVSPFTPNFG